MKEFIEFIAPHLNKSIIEHREFLVLVTLIGFATVGVLMGKVSAWMHRGDE